MQQAVGIEIHELGHFAREKGVGYLQCIVLEILHIEKLQYESSKNLARIDIHDILHKKTKFNKLNHTM